MTREAKMSLGAKREYIQVVRIRYRNSAKKERTLILDEFCKVLDVHRKHAIQLLGGSRTVSGRRPGPSATYSEECGYHLSQIWELTGRICSKKLKAAIPIWLPYYLDALCHDKMRQQLLTMSPATIDRLLRAYRATAKKRGLSSTCAATIKSRIPIELLHGEVKDPGHLEVDTVAHCGDSLIGLFANSLTATDLATGWTENRAMWNKHATEVVKALIDIEDKMPFLLKSISSDNGSEFLNKDLLKHCNTRNGGPIKLCRRRPYKKNDAAHVEQKNWTHVRQLFGYYRFDDEVMVSLMNEIYRAFWNPLHNMFIPSMRLVKKTRIGGRIKKEYEAVPKTPLERVLQSDSVSEVTKDRLRKEFRATNPVLLKQLLTERMENFLKLVRINESNRSLLKNKSA